MVKWQQLWQNLGHSRRRLVGVAAVLTVTIIVVLAAIDGIGNARKTANINVLIAPESALIKINDQTYRNGSYKIEPGDFTVLITKDGFDQYQEHFSLVAGETKELSLYLTQSDGKYDWYAKNPRDSAIMTTIGDRQADANGQQALEKYPILKILPYNDNVGSPDYTISPKFEDNELTGLLIEFNTCADYSKVIYRQEALAWLTKQGFNPADYQIETADICS